MLKLKDREISNTLLNKDHELYQLTEKIDWNYLYKEAQKLFNVTDEAQFRLIIGLIYLKVWRKLSTKDAITYWLNCPYWRYFCGYHPTQQLSTFPCSMVVVDIWQREMHGKGNDLMMSALLRKTLLKPR